MTRQGCAIVQHIQASTGVVAEYVTVIRRLMGGAERLRSASLPFSHKPNEVLRLYVLQAACWISYRREASMLSETESKLKALVLDD